MPHRLVFPYSLNMTTRYQKNITLLQGFIYYVCLNATPVLPDKD